MYVYMFVTTAIRCNVMPIPIQSLSIWSVRMPAWRCGICFIIFTLWMNGWMQCTHCFFLFCQSFGIFIDGSSSSSLLAFFLSLFIYISLAIDVHTDMIAVGIAAPNSKSKFVCKHYTISFRFVSFRFKPDTKGHKSNINYFLIDIDTSTFGWYECV